MPTHAAAGLVCPSAAFRQPHTVTANLVGVTAFVLGMPLWGALRDCIGWSVTLAVGAMLNTAISTWFFETLPTLPPTGLELIGAFVVVGLGAGFLHAIIAGLIAALSPTAIRQSGYALPYSIGTAAFTGLTPLTLAWLLRDHGLSAPLYQYLTACVVALGVAASVRVMPRYLGEG